MKSFLIVFSIFSTLFLSMCSSPQKETKELPKNEVIVLGMIHSGHKTSELYSTEVLKNIIKEINPDFILTEIPPDRFATAVKEFQDTDTIKEPRVIRFPEYVDVIFPLTKEMDFEIIPTAGWTSEMADARSKRMREIRQDSLWTDRWKQYTQANEKSDSVMASLGNTDDPYLINSAAYDETSEIALSVYNDLFNDELGPGGWDNINKAHFSYIEKALDKYSGQGKRILITYGAGHKGWFLKSLKKRDDIELLEVKPFLDALK